MTRRSVALLAALLSLCTFAPAQAAECSFGGPTPGWHALKLNLPEGSSFLTLELGGARSSIVGRPVQDDNNWHLAQGIFVVNAQTRALEAYRIDSQGMAPRRIVARHDGQTFVEQNAPAPDVRYEHHASKLRPGLPPGQYYVIAFGTDGGRMLPNEWWSAGLQVQGTHSCAVIGAGETFDFDHTDFSGGSQVALPGAGRGEGLARAYNTQRGIVVGLMEAQTQARAVGSATLEYATPTATGRLSQQIVPFVSSAGAYSFSASYQGYYPTVLVAGVALDLP